MKTTANANKIVMLLFLICLLGLESCSDTNQQSKLTEKLQFKTNEEAINSMYNNFLHEKTVCHNFVAAIAKDREFIENVENNLLDYRERESGQRIFEILAKSKAAKVEVVQYVLRNRGYFWIDLDFHELPGVTFVENSNIYCMQTDKRLKEIEELGLSEQSWKVREHYLNLSLNALLEFGMPGYVGPVTYAFKDFESKFDTVKKMYSPKFRESLRQWVQKAALRLKEGTNKASVDLMPKEQQLSIVEGWITELKKEPE